ncbi:hypothetical protein PAHAL_7G244200 [Panicum hallii]|uniref:O-fucosyltransferase family protein n=1 Tax=Panicum hallii TaxID=206008 RepID=A0A2T8IDF4_9POAL|nr:hypothetical protein PAHAL_7G244200 [Panicum hallii]
MGRKPDPVAKPHHSGGGGASSPRAARKAPPSPVFLGTALFVLGFVSLFTGHVVTDADWSRIRSRWRSKQVIYLGFPPFYSLIARNFVSAWSLVCGNLIEVRERRLCFWPLDGYTYTCHIAGNNLRKVRIYEPIDIWKSRYSSIYYGCSGRSTNFRSAVPENNSTGYLLIATSGGLNQQRIGITDAVVVAWILNATLVVPELDHHSFWKDESDFSDIFDVDWFISYLSKDVTVVKRIPYEVMLSMDKLPWTMRAPRKSMPEFYIDEVLPILMRRRALQLTKFDYRLTSELDEDLQKLRCRVNFHALRFANSIHTLGQKLVHKLRLMSPRYVAVHLRFEPDMLAFSGCYYGGGEKERKELGEIRKRWDTLPVRLLKLGVEC